MPTLKEDRVYVRSYVRFHGFVRVNVCTCVRVSSATVSARKIKVLSAEIADGQYYAAVGHSKNQPEAKILLQKRYKTATDESYADSNITKNNTDININTNTNYHHQQAE